MIEQIRKKSAIFCAHMVDFAGLVTFVEEFRHLAQVMLQCNFTVPSRCHMKQLEHASKDFFT